MQIIVYFCKTKIYRNMSKENKEKQIYSGDSIASK
nr:MAG TPA: hypothetical protein [Crassvirales sp.]